MTSGPGARRTRTAACLALAVLLGAAGCGDGPDPPSTDRGALETYLQQAPGVPLVLPTQLPGRYVFLGPGWEQSEDGRMYIRESDYRLDARDASTVVVICTLEPGRPRDSCVPEGPDGSDGPAIERRLGAYPVWIRPVGSDRLSAAERDFWSTVPLSDDLGAVSWLT